MNQKECEMKIVESLKKLTEVEKKFFSKQIELNEAYKEYAKELGKGVKKLTDEEKRQALLIASMKANSLWIELT